MDISVAFHEIPHSDAVEAYVRKHATKLEAFSDRWTGCRVVLDAPHKHGRKGRHYRVGIDLTIPRGELVVNRAPADDVTNEDLYAAIDEAFDRLTRRLKEYVRQQRDFVKSNRAAPPRSRNGLERG
jgi:ribosomal subunit interface protein